MSTGFVCEWSSLGLKKTVFRGVDLGYCFFQLGL